jgi:hypothetical protein
MRLSPRVKRVAAIFSLDSLHPNGCAERTKKTKAAHQSIKGIAAVTPPTKDPQ